MLFAVHDWETTGLPFHFQANPDLQPRGIEFAGIITDGVNIIDTLEFICNPEREIEEIITKITGLTNDDLVTKPVFGHFTEQVKAYFKQANAAISHNLSFDKGITMNELRVLEMQPEDICWPSIEICTVEQTMEKYGRRMKLSELYEIHCGAYTQKHRALDDVMLLHEVCKAEGVYAAFQRGDK